MKKYKLTTIIIIGLLGLLVSVIGIVLSHKHNSKNTAVNAVNLMYNFDTYDEVYNKQMEELKEICEPEVYNKLNVINIDRALNSYLRFKGNPSKVVIKEVTESYVLYTIDSISITENRMFLLMYKVNWKGNLEYVEECEIVNFY